MEKLNEKPRFTIYERVEDFSDAKAFNDWAKNMIGQEIARKLPEAAAGKKAVIDHEGVSRMRPAYYEEYSHEILQIVEKWRGKTQEIHYQNNEQQELVHPLSLEQPETLRDQYLIRDVILRNRGYSSYDEFLDSPYWHKVKLKAWQGPNKENYDHCNICMDENTRPLHLHHRDYKYLGNFNKELINVITLCPQCHERLHQLANRYSIKLQHAEELLKNGIPF